ncbi:bile acid:sodium symporter family protein [Pseudonocardia hispaniensis]|uniref:Bile acid:sodium symporter family protein n=1 Tax=Pseudonocardia hispaniensis TaxID=904933 RepID=A0ABW1J228_9PSEU
MRHLRPDPYLLLLLVTVGVASLLPARGAAATIAGHAVTVAIGLLFFLYGARLAPRAALAGLRHWRLHGTVLAATFVLFPLLGLAAQLLSPSILSPSLAIGVLFLCCLPSTVQSSIAFTSVARGNVAAAVCAASFSNLVGVVGTPLLAGLLLAAHGGFSGRAVIDIGLQLLAPFLLGQLLRPWIGGWTERHRRLLGAVDRGSILLIVYVAFSASMTAGIWSRLTLPDLAVLLAVDAALLAVVLLATVVVPRALGLDHADRATIMFCGSTKSLAAGLPMAGVLFAGQPVGLVVLPLMLFHQLQLMVCAALAPRMAPRSADAEARPVPVG